MKKQIDSKVIAHSISPSGDKCASFVLTYPRFIHSEVMTHRMFSRNAASSRAIPFEKMVKSVEENPFIPIAWQKDHKGMQGTEYLDANNSEVCKQTWLEARDWAVNQAKMLSNFECTKQLCNRLLEPFLWYTCIITVTQLQNFFNLRCPQYEIELSGKSYTAKSWRELISLQSNNEDILILTELGKDPIERLKLNKGAGEIHIMELAERMYDSINESTPKQLKAGEWHIPFGDNIDLSHSSLDSFKYSDRGLTQEEMDLLRIKIATARCARVSYENFEGEDDYLKDIALFEKLAGYGHASPFEHCAQVPTPPQLEYTGWSGNFKGFIQLRKIMEQRGDLKTSTN